MANPYSNLSAPTLQNAIDQAKLEALTNDTGVGVVSGQDVARAQLKKSKPMPSPSVYPIVAPEIEPNQNIILPSR